MAARTHRRSVADRSTRAAFLLSGRTQVQWTPKKFLGMQFSLWEGLAGHRKMRRNL
nr:MAG TPA: hypothetical protein [Caudoviricetes sp.]